MPFKPYIYIVAAALIVIASVAGITAWSNHKIVTLERTVEDAEKQAQISTRKAFDAERATAQYRQKIDYLEQQFTEIQKLARKQDEQMDKLIDNSGRARSDVERARGIRSIDATAAELCEKLADLGHGCR
ncbi:MAG: hypothetical protein ABR530_09065 [Pyrinomonadaceae bacterium]